MDFPIKRAQQNIPIEWPLTSKKDYADPFNEVETSAIFKDPEGEERVVPAYWSGDRMWRIRYSSPLIGTHTFQTTCSDSSDLELNSLKGTLEVIKYKGSNPLLKHGPLRVSQDRSHLEHLDGTSFFWLGDTWWMGLCKRLPWPDGFKTLSRDRVKKSFSVIQIVAGLYPDMPPFDRRGSNEAGFPWATDYSRINPQYFKMADRRIDWLVRSGLVPCIVAAWGYFMDFAGCEVMKKQWRNLVARYWAYPVVWCVAGEATMPYYLSPIFSLPSDRIEKREYETRMRAQWTEVARYLKSIDPHHHPITIHAPSRNMVEDPSVIDIDMIGGSHFGDRDLNVIVNNIVDARSKSPQMPVLDGETCYEGIVGANWENVQRYAFWSSVLCGACGHTYGANGIWQLNTRKTPFGPSPHGRSWGPDIPWEDAYKLPGSRQLGLAKRLLERYQWWRFEPHPEWIEPHWTKDSYYDPYAAGIPGEVRLVYSISIIWKGPPMVKQIEPDIPYHAVYVDPRTGRQHEMGKVAPDAHGDWQAPVPPSFQDWILILEKVD